MNTDQIGNHARRCSIISRSVSCTLYMFALRLWELPRPSVFAYRVSSIAGLPVIGNKLRKSLDMLSMALANLPYSHWNDV